MAFGVVACVSIIRESREINNKIRMCDIPRHELCQMCAFRPFNNYTHVAWIIP